MSDRRSTDRPGGRPVDPHNISSARTPPTAVCPGSRSNLDLLTATRFCRALPGRFESNQDDQQTLTFTNPLTNGMKMTPEVTPLGYELTGSGLTSFPGL